MGGASSRLEKALGDLPDGEHVFGLENFGNTCYCNSVLQALYFCQPFRKRVLEYAEAMPGGRENLLTCLADLFVQISSQKRKTGVIAPRKFVERLRQDNELFRSYMHQDAHEFLNYLVNECAEILEKEAREGAGDGAGPTAEGPPPSGNGGAGQGPRTFVPETFQGKLVNETRCLCCETVTCRDEHFMDLSVDVEQNSSITACLKNFSSTETLNMNNKFYCDSCCTLQEAQKRMRIKELPQVLALHLKRFKYIEQLQRHKKLTDRVLFPFDLKLCNTTDDAEHVDVPYQLFAVVVHVGSGPNHGHYVSAVKAHGRWIFFDDESVDSIGERTLYSFFGSSSELASGTEHGYILLYERVAEEA